VSNYVLDDRENFHLKLLRVFPDIAVVVVGYFYCSTCSIQCI